MNHHLTKFSKKFMKPIKRFETVRQEAGKFGGMIPQKPKQLF